MRDHFINLLNQQPLRNLGNPASKLNIHIPLEGKIVDYCVGLNKEIQKITPSLIDFGPSSFQSPHLTIDMGFVNSENDFKQLMDAIQSFAKELDPFSISSGKPYLGDFKAGYVLMDIEPQEFLHEIKLKAKQRFSPFLQSLDWDICKAASHITLAFVEDHFKEIRMLLDKYPSEQKCIANALEVSFVGPKGSCLGNLKKIEF